MATVMPDDRTGHAGAEPPELFQTVVCELCGLNVQMYARVDAMPNNIHLVSVWNRSVRPKGRTKVSDTKNEFEEKF